MVTITVSNVLSNVIGVPEHLQGQLMENLSYLLSGGYTGMPDQKKFLYNPKTGMTYSGLVPRIIDFLNYYKVEFKLIDKRGSIASNANFSMSKKFKAHSYQKDIIDRINNREIIQAATGAGKTFIIAALIAKFNVKPTVIIAPKVSLMIQIKEEMEKFLGEKVGMVGGGYSDVQDITVVTPGSAPMDLIRSARALFWDECHNIPSKSIFTISTNAINSYYRIGVSATPWRDYGDDILIEAAINKLKPEYSINASKLIKLGKLVPCNIHFTHVNSNTGWLGNYIDTYDKAIVENPVRNKMIVDTAVNAFNNNKHVLVLVSRVEHGEHLLQQIRARVQNKPVSAGGQIINTVEFLSGDDDITARENVFTAVRNGDCRILIGTTIADEGLDITILNTLILAGAGKSSTKAFQRIGRVLRLHENKDKADVYDFIDSYETFHRHAQTRYSLYKTETAWNIKII